MFKRILKIKTLLFFYLFLIFDNLYAEPPHQVLEREEGTPYHLYHAFLRIIYWLFAFLTLASLIGIIIGAYLIIFSGGESGKLENGKKAIIYSLVALLIASFAWAIVLWAESGFVF